MPKIYSLFTTLQTWTWKDAFSAAFLFWVAYYVAVGTYRIYFHPLAKFPGPKVISQKSQSFINYIEVNVLS
jgi:hypothetical protein